MRRAALLLWLIAPALLLAWHLGPGQRQVLLDRVAAQREQAHAAAAAGDWQRAAGAAGAALATLAEADALAAGTTSDQDARKRPPSAAAAALTLDQARARIHQGELLDGIEQLDVLVDATAADPAQHDIASAARHELASASYAAAWLMRLEGASADEWKPDAEQARQQFRLLAEEGGALADASTRNLESAIRLERMDLTELQGLALPRNCNCNGKNLSQRRRQQRESQSRKPGQSQEPKKNDDAREQIKQQTNAAGQQARGSGDGS